MTQAHTQTTPPDADAIRDRVLHALALNRNGRLHFPGYFVGLECSRMTVDGVNMAIPDGPHVRDADGGVNISALALLADVALGSVARPSLHPGVRMATMHMHMRFTGEHAAGPVSVEARLLGFNAAARLRQSLATAALYSNGRIVAHASGEFGVLNAPPGVTLVPLPWECDAPPPPTPVDEHDLKADERAVLKACDAARANITPRTSFIQQFWGGLPRRNASSVSNRVTNGTHLGNRVGHVQGGVMFGIAAACASAAVPDSMMLSSVSAWFISPGRSEALRIRSRVVHTGRTIAVVRTEVRTAGNERVLEVISHHVARQRHAEHGPA